MILLSADLTVRITDSKNNIAGYCSNKTKSKMENIAHTFVAGGQMSKSGEYTVTAFWNNNIAIVTFELTGITGSNVSTPAPAPESSTV